MNVGKGSTFLRTFVFLSGAVLLIGSCGPEPGLPGEEGGGVSGDWAPVPGLRTRWAAEINPAASFGEYPRPQMVRTEWMSLNGLWGFARTPVDSEGSAVPGAETYQEEILVPFPMESALSGLATTMTPQERAWYRRVFRLPEAAEGTRWLLHFGAVDWEAEVFLNGVRLGIHRGGYDPFSFDITEALREGREQELVVGVWDPTDQGDQPRGKQVLDPHGIWYTAVTGIWQTVWLEPVPTTHVAGLVIAPDVASETVAVTVEVQGPRGKPEVDVTVLVGGEDAAPVVQARGRAGEELRLRIPQPRLWSPDDPYLYGLRVELEGGDVVESYFGMRSIAVGPDGAGRPRLILNGEPLFQFGLLDQGWWPDGLYTAPTDDALRFDVEATKDLGYNLIRKHVKVEPDRWYYHADRVGLLVWQDMPSGGNEGPEAKEQFGVELRRMVDALRNHPCIVMWVPFNEGWGQHDTESYVTWLADYDPTRLVNNASGWADRGVGDVLDVHRYPGPGVPDGVPPRLDPAEGLPEGPSGQRAPVLGEFGGLGLPLEGHTWLEEDNWGYRSYESQEALQEAYADLLFQLHPLIGEGLAGAVYTQTTDVEIEVNGVMTYDREIVKLSPGVVADHLKLYGAPPVLRPLLATSLREGQGWRYTLSPPSPDWVEVAFDDATWERGLGGFGTPETPGALVRTVWDTPELWLRRAFELKPDDLPGQSAGRLFLRIHHDEDVDIYLNSTLMFELEGHTTGYRLMPLSTDVAALLRTGRNVLAVHVRNTRGGQYLDLGIVELLEGGEG